MNRSRLKSVLTIVLGTALIALLSGCDARENADTEKGRDLFIASCGTCHALKAANTTSTIGPDLDASFAAARAAGMDQDTIEGVVAAQIAEPRVTDEQDPTYMPPGILEGQEAEDVATYVGAVAGVPGIEAPLAPGGPGGQVFDTAGCAACHTLGVSESTGNVGPNLDNDLPGQSAEMIRESIVDPNVEIVEGFEAGIMPEDYEQSIPPEDLDKLVNYLFTCAGIGTSADGGNEDQEFEEDGSCAGVSTGGGGNGGGK